MAQQIPQHAIPLNFPHIYLKHDVNKDQVIVMLRRLFEEKHSKFHKPEIGMGHCKVINRERWAFTVLTVGTIPGAPHEKIDLMIDEDHIGLYFRLAWFQTGHFTHTHWVSTNTRKYFRNLLIEMVSQMKKNGWLHPLQTTEVASLDESCRKTVKLPFPASLTSSLFG